MATDGSGRVTMFARADCPTNTGVGISMTRPVPLPFILFMCTWRGPWYCHLGSIEVVNLMFRVSLSVCSCVCHNFVCTIRFAFCSMCCHDTYRFCQQRTWTSGEVSVNDSRARRLYDTQRSRKVTIVWLCVRASRRHLASVTSALFAWTRSHVFSNVPGKAVLVEGQFVMVVSGERPQSLWSLRAWGFVWTHTTPHKPLRPHLCNKIVLIVLRVVDERLNSERVTNVIRRYVELDFEPVVT